MPEGVCEKLGDEDDDGVLVTVRLPVAESVWLTLWDGDVVSEGDELSVAVAEGVRVALPVCVSDWDEVTVCEGV